MSEKAFSDTHTIGINITGAEEKFNILFWPGI